MRRVLASLYTGTLEGVAVDGLPLAIPMFHQC